MVVYVDTYTHSPHKKADDLPGNYQLSGFGLFSEREKFSARQVIPMTNVGRTYLRPYRIRRRAKVNDALQLKYRKQVNHRFVRFIKG